jgi:anti-sigma factor RsiW
MSARLCPMPEQLLAYLQGRLPPAQQEETAAHLEGCHDCQARADQFERRDDPLLAALRDIGPAESVTSEEELDRLLHLARELPSRERIGDYVLVRKLGQGGFGDVYLARSELLDRLVAVKVLRAAHRADPDTRSRFLQELRAVGKLRPHPHVVQALHAAEDAGTLYLVMEYVEGSNLAPAGPARAVRGGRCL